MKLLKRRNKLPMRRQDVRELKRWLASLHPHANKKYGFRDGGYRGHRIQGYSPLPTHAAAIRRYFAWCKSHKLDPTERRSQCLYWGICERNDSYGPIFRAFSPAIIENVIGATTGWLSQEDDEQRYRDAWKIVIEGYTDDAQYLEEHKHSFPVVRGPLGYEEGHRPSGRIFRGQAVIRLDSSEMFGYMRDRAISVYSRIALEYTTKASYKVQATTRLTPQHNSTLDDLLEAMLVSELMPKYLPRDWSVRLQRHAYRDRKSIARDAERALKRRLRRLEQERKQRRAANE